MTFYNLSFWVVMNLAQDQSATSLGTVIYAHLEVLEAQNSSIC